MFNLKDTVSNVHKSYVVYKFTCAGCNSCYIGETTRHYSIRIHEHLNTDKTSSVYKHLKANPACNNLCNAECFSILDGAQTQYPLNIKENMYISWEKPNLNKQVKCFIMTLTF